MSNTTITGLIDTIFPFETKGNFTKRVLWIKEDAGQYPQFYEIEFLGDDGKRLNDYAAGQKVIVDCEVRGRRWDPGGSKGARVFVSLKATGMRRPTEQTRSHNPRALGIKEEANPDHEVLDDDLPF